MAIAGRVAIVPKGDWSAETEYKRLDEVTYNNTMFIAKKAVPKGTLPTNAEYWSKSIVGGVGAIAKPEEAGIVKPDGKSMSVDESGTLSINLDGTTITLDEAKNVIKLADTLKDAINGAFPAANVANNQITTVEGFALDARQANPNLDGTLAKQISDLNGSIVPQIPTLNNGNVLGETYYNKPWLVIKDLISNIPLKDIVAFRVSAGVTFWAIGKREGEKYASFLLVSYVSQMFHVYCNNGTWYVDQLNTKGETSF